MMMTPEEYCIRLIDLPGTVKALVVYDDEGFPNINVNSRLSREEQAEAVRHELVHIQRDDAYNDRSIREAEAHSS